MSDIVIYDDGTLALSATVENETVWLNRHQMAKLFDRDVKTIGKHLANIFKEKELEKNATVANFATVQKEGHREITRDRVCKRWHRPQSKSLSWIMMKPKKR